MSAWIVSREHIDVLVTALHPAEKHQADELGRMLWGECLRSVAHRYPCDQDGVRPGPCDFRDSDVDTYTFTPREVPPSWVLSAAQCYAYQSCEHPQWEASRARQIIAELVARYATYERSRDHNRPLGPDNPPGGISADDLAELNATVSA